MSKIINLLNILLLLFQLSLSCWLIVNQERIPIHWSIDGSIDSYGSPYIVLLLPFSALIAWGLISFIKRHPQYCNMPPSVKDKSKGMIVIKQMLDMIVLWSFLLTSFLTVCVVSGRLYGIGLGVLLILLAAIIIIYSAKLAKTP